ncbi:MAG: RNA methyltransferase [Actinobacteria bacterium]|nr:MAG: RNA methyltransferase [Actinomycetota bacterium]
MNSPRRLDCCVPVLRVSPEDPRLADYRNVPDPELLASRGVFVAEGRHVVRRLLTESRFRTRSLLLTAAALDVFGDVTGHVRDLPIFVVEQSAMNDITGFNIHRGCLAIGERPAPVPWTDIVRDARLVVVLEGVANADNVGGIFRNAAAFGADAVLAGPSCTDPLYRKAIRTSMGAALRVPFAAMSGWPADLIRLRERGFSVVALTPEPSAVPLYSCATALRKERVALLLGHEGGGLSAGALQAATVRVRIPTSDAVDSLNVAAAAAIALYELRFMIHDS